MHEPMMMYDVYIFMKFLKTNICFANFCDNMFFYDLRREVKVKVLPFLCNPVFPCISLYLSVTLYLNANQSTIKAN